MSVPAVRHVLKHSRATGGSRLVLLVLAEHYNADDPEQGCWPSVARIAHQAGISKRHVQRCLRTLEAMGEIVTERPEGRALPIYLIRNLRERYGVEEDDEDTSDDIHVTRKVALRVTPMSPEVTSRRGDTHVAPPSGDICDIPASGDIQVAPASGDIRVALNRLNRKEQPGEPVTEVVASAARDPVSIPLPTRPGEDPDPEEIAQLRRRIEAERAERQRRREG